MFELLRTVAIEGLAPNKGGYLWASTPHSEVGKQPAAGQVKRQEGGRGLTRSNWTGRLDERNAPLPRPFKYALAEPDGVRGQITAQECLRLSSRFT